MENLLARSEILGAKCDHLGAVWSPGVSDVTEDAPPACGTWSAGLMETQTDRDVSLVRLPLISAACKHVPSSLRRYVTSRASENVDQRGSWLGGVLATRLVFLFARTEGWGVSRGGGEREGLWRNAALKRVFFFFHARPSHYFLSPGSNAVCFSAEVFQVFGTSASR